MRESRTKNESPQLKKGLENRSNILLLSVLMAREEMEFDSSLMTRHMWAHQTTMVWRCGVVFWQQNTGREDEHSRRRQFIRPSRNGDSL
jgi:hypothetical protein